MSDHVAFVTRIAAGLLRIGIGLFAAGLTAGLGLILRYFYVTPLEICSTAFAAMTVDEAWPWALPLLATQGFALGVAVLGLALLVLKPPPAPPSLPGMLQQALPTREG